MFAVQHGRLSACLTAAAVAALAVAALGWPASDAAGQQVENPPLRAPANDTVPNPIGDLDKPIGTGQIKTTVVPGQQPDDSRLFFAVVIVLAVFIIPVLLANYLSKTLRMPDHFMRIAVVLFAILASSAATYFEWPPKLGIDLRGGVILIYEVEQKDFKEMEKLVSAVSKRVNPGGIKEVTVRPYGEREIEIIIPEADQAELDRTQKIVRQQGQLEFRIVADDRYDAELMQVAQEPRFQNQKEVYETEVAEGEGEKRYPDARWVPVAPDEARRFAADRHFATRQNKRGQFEVLLLVDKLHVTGDYLTTATPSFDRVGKPSVSFGFNEKGARLFGKLTGNNLPDPAHADLQRLLAIVLDGELQSAPAIRSQITDRGEITGSFTQQDVEDLSAVLTAGSLPTTLRKEPTTSLVTGPTLGRDTIRKGVYSMLVSTVAVVLFMLFYYRFAGMVANLALLLNVLLIVAFMILFHAAFTLSGLAGLALTVGMAVDANVLIYERMREELGRGATLRMAIRNGFDRATTTIVDANVTTLISAVVLFWIGTDQVKGFAVTLILGIVMNLFTAITFTRLLFDIGERQRWLTRLKMLHVLENPNFDFIGKRFLAIGFSVLIIGIGLVGVVQRGRGLLDIDFTGGVSVEALFEKPQDIADIRDRVKDLPDVTVQDIHITGEPLGKRFLIITSKSDIDETQEHPTGPKTNIDWVEEQLKEAFNDGDHRLAFNHLSWNELTTVTEAAGTDSNKKEAADDKPADEAPSTDEEKPADETEKAQDSSPPADGKPSDEEKSGDEKPAGEEKESRFLPGDESLLALAQDEPAEKETPAEDAKKGTGDAAEPETSAGEKSADPAATTDTMPDEEKTAAPEDDQTDDGAAPPKSTPKAGQQVVDHYVGGSTTTLTFSETVDHDTLEERFKDALNATGHKGEDVLFSLDNREYESGSNRGFKTWTLKIALPTDKAQPVLENVERQFAERPYFPSSNKVGASVAGNTQLQATYALLASLVLIVVYVWIRFQQVSFGFAAVLALIHDVLVALGGLAVSYWLARMPFMDALLMEPFKINLPIIAAFLTIIGYSINDTIVIFDRIREVRGKSPDMSADLVNLCINQTLSRTLLTSLTVFIVVLILYIFGGQGIHGFAFTLVVGTISGTYSTVYIATPVLIWMNRRKSTDKARPGNMGREAA
ncbi:MAG TPA: protein translocase subunit SecD [Pirellulales bacterium]|nr:protein translocase subunit SecD [Pirellulales bacterium]